MSELRYNIALIPSPEDRQRYIDIAHHYFKSIHSGYILGPSSLPHVTLAQFSCEPPTAQAVMQAVASSVLLQEPIAPKIKGLSIQTLDRHFAHHQSGELSIVRSTSLVMMQKAAAKIAHKHELGLYNHDGEAYRPHLTLAVFGQTAAVIPLQLPEVLFAPITFRVAFGQADRFWQFNRILQGAI